MNNELQNFKAGYNSRGQKLQNAIIKNLITVSII